ncbi:hypothetical protein ACBI99_37010 [Nonomuraea sp. ATR24]|uniref:hypothetical protein n=1 Tax=Nonomuraea sp. ATR24 TaxID=1676744 RepID=UPI0035BFE762
MVIADAGSENFEELKAFNDKILAVDLEVRGLVQAYDAQNNPQDENGWAIVFGISDHAGLRKSDDHNQVAAQHAAQVLRHLLP